MEAAPLSARDRILATAHDLFYRDGIRATGIDRLIAESGVTKVTFYRHFPSKNDLVRAFLDLRHARWMAWFVDALGRRGADMPAADGSSLLLLADVLQEWTEMPVFRGCAFINTVVEIADALPEAVEAARLHKQEMAEVIAELLPPGPARSTQARAAALAFDGAIVHAQMARDAAERRTVVALLRSLLQGLHAP
ncbi:TetR/AcrR family transcriptional regulator [Variovorax sp. N23]|uniref:TetR/AcrR family transcriptional regulator n=1 Tax=Variovorax sp. N23 TaxID=2980555 RepID=UPI0021C78BD0|nr:TetR/AcrR family transcriptional regulator [Variovorax sp. N23]MCU4118700.1 TetR/AcrR family transcriptional regulator [Variovorax sp. N23]